MFRSLRLKLTLVNMAIIALLFLVLTVGSYLFVQNKMIAGAKFRLQRIADDLDQGRINDLPPREIRQPLAGNPPPPPPPLPRNTLIFYAKTDSSEEITATSSNVPITQSDLPALIHQTLTKGDVSSVIHFRQVDYVYFTTRSSNQNEYLILFQDFSQEQNLLQMLTTALIIIGLICVGLSFIGSLYVANKAMLPIQEAWQQQKDFLADASHELRTPLAIIQTNLEIVHSSPDDKIGEHAHWLTNICEEVAGMTKLVDALLLLARAEAHQQLLQLRPVNLTETASIASHSFRPAAQAKNIGLRVQAENITIIGDELRLRQLIGILLDNAIRHTPNGGTINVTVTRNGRFAILSVSDTGEGIAAPHLDKIFNRFYQVDSSRAKGGAGLGLAIAKWIVKGHGGKLTVESTPGLGTSFSAWLPAK